MDCEKFESMLIDELYGELDELNSAASKRHVAGCARCASLLGGLKATRRLAVLPMVVPPADLESKILAAEQSARKVVPFRARMTRAISRAGSWAMRPQTQMAALFLLMIGSSVAFLRARVPSSADKSASMVVTENGAPAATAMASAAPAGQSDPMDLAAAATAHGPLEAERQKQANAPAAIAADKTAETQSGLKDDELALQQRAASNGTASKGALDTDNMLGPGGGGGSGGATLGAAASAAPAAQANTTTASAEQSGAFANAMAAYRAKNYDEATRDFDALAATGDDNSALWAARSVRESSGCGAAVNRFDQITGRAFGTQPGYDATFESGECYKSMGSFDAARQRFSRLLTVPSHAARAQAELNKMSPSPYEAKPKRVAPAPAQQVNQSAY